MAAKIAIAIILVLALLVVSVFGAFFVLKHVGEQDMKPQITADTNYQETIEYNGHTYQYNEDIFAMAFVGVDKREMETSDETDFVGAGDADAVIAINTKTGKTSVIAVPRDTMVDVDVYSERIFLRTQKMQLCLAYAYGDGATQSCENAVTAISRVLMDIPIHKYFVLNLDGIAPLNDAIGGVTVQSLYHFEEQGINVGDTVTLKGDMAEVYVRQRDMDSITASLNRTDRQVQYIKAYTQQALPAVTKNFMTVTNLYNTASNYSQTNLTLSNATYLASFLLSKGITDYDSYTLTGEMKSSPDSLMPDVVHAEFYPDEDYLTETIIKVFYTQID